jgi:DNA-directed RNA polymerase subunit RPC12/RpoP
MESKTNFLKYGFCKSCNKPFEFPDWVFEQNTLIKDMRCPNCESKSIFSSTKLSKAIIEQKPFEELLALAIEVEQNTKDLMEKIKMREAISNEEL